MKYFRLISFSLLLLLTGCGKDDNGSDLPSVDDRVADAIESLRDQLTSPEFGWELHYRPTDESGEYYILLEFSDEEVNIKSDISYDNGYLYDQTIPYRIDAQLGIELIFETYAVFHYLFEQDQSTFGAEFQFIFIDEENSNLYFSSKSDGSNDQSLIIFEPASNVAHQNFTREIDDNLQYFDLLSPIIFGGENIQQLYLPDHDVSIFWDIDLVKRNVVLDVAAVGETDMEIVANNQIVSINHSSGYTLLNGKMVFLAPFSFTLSGESYTINEIVLEDFSLSGEIFCNGDTENSPVYEGSIEGYGAVYLKKSYFQSGGLNFKAQEESYSVNAFFLFDNDANSLLEDGVIGQFYPEATGFIFNFDYVSDGIELIPSFGVGIRFLDENDVSQLHMRSYDMTSLQGNSLGLTFNDQFYYSNGGNAEDEQNLRMITEEIFEGGKVFVTLLDDEDVSVFRLFNVCNGYEFFLVQ